MSSGEDIYTLSSTTSLGRKRKSKAIEVIVGLLGQYLSSNASVLEVGTGRGEFAQEITKKGYNYIGIEPSSKLREMLADRNLELISEAIPEINLQNDVVDMVYSFDVVEHLQLFTDVVRFFEESNRVLKVNGHIVVIAPNYETLGKLFYLYEYQHSFVTTLRRIETMFVETGFKIIESRPFLTNYGLSSNKLLNVFDRVLANIVLIFARNGIVISILKAIFGKEFVFKVHKNLYDHIVVIGQKI